MQKSFFIIDKIKKYRKCQALLIIHKWQTQETFFGLNPRRFPPTWLVQRLLLAVDVVQEVEDAAGVLGHPVVRPDHEVVVEDLALLAVDKKIRIALDFLCACLKHRHTQKVEGENYFINCIRHQTAHYKVFCPNLHWWFYYQHLTTKLQVQLDDRRGREMFNLQEHSCRWGWAPSTCNRCYSSHPRSSAWKHHTPPSLTKNGIFR